MAVRTHPSLKHGAGRCARGGDPAIEGHGVGHFEGVGQAYMFPEHSMQVLIFPVVPQTDCAIKGVYKNLIIPVAEP